MALLKGPFTITFAGASIKDISELSWDYSSDETTPTTIDGRTYHIPTTTSASITITLLGADIAALGTIFPQYLVMPGEKMSTGETNSGETPAFDVLAMSACDSTALSGHLEVRGCDTTTRLVNAKARIDSLDYEDNVIQTVQVVFSGEPEAGQAVFQMYKNDTLTEPETD